MTTSTSPYKNNLLSGFISLALLGAIGISLVLYWLSSFTLLEIALIALCGGTAMGGLFAVLENSSRPTQNKRADAPLWADHNAPETKTGMSYNDEPALRDPADFTCPSRNSYIGILFTVFMASFGLAGVAIADLSGLYSFLTPTQLWYTLLFGSLFVVATYAAIDEHNVTNSYVTPAQNAQRGWVVLSAVVLLFLTGLRHHAEIETIVTAYDTGFVRDTLIWIILFGVYGIALWSHLQTRFRSTASTGS